MKSLRMAKSLAERNLNVMIKYIAPICLLFIFVTGILSQLGIITI